MEAVKSATGTSTVPAVAPRATCRKVLISATQEAVKAFMRADMPSHVVYMQTCIQVFIYVYMCMYARTPTCVCMYVCVHIKKFTELFTYIHTPEIKVKELLRQTDHDYGSWQEHWRGLALVQTRQHTSLATSRRRMPEKRDSNGWKPTPCQRHAVASVDMKHPSTSIMRFLGPQNLGT